MVSPTLTGRLDTQASYVANDLPHVSRPLVSPSAALSVDQTVTGRLAEHARNLKQKPVWEFKLGLKNSACPNILQGVTAECQFQLGNEFCLAKTEYRTKKPHSSPFT